MTDGLFITFWYRPKNASYQCYDVAVLDLNQQSFADWYLETVHIYCDQQEVRIVSAVPITRRDIEKLNEAEVGE